MNKTVSGKENLYFEMESKAPNNGEAYDVVIGESISLTTCEMKCNITLTRYNDKRARTKTAGYKEGTVRITGYTCTLASKGIFSGLKLSTNVSYISRLLVTL